MNVLMVGVDDYVKGGMWTVVENYLNNKSFCQKTGLNYIPTASGGSAYRRINLFISAFFKIRREIKTGKYQILHMHLSERSSIYRKYLLQRMAKKFGLKTVIHMHGGHFERLYKAAGSFKKKIAQDVLNGSDSILILGQYNMAFVSSIVEDPSKIQVLYNAVSVAGQNLYNKNARDILFLGVVTQRKGVFDLLNAFAQIKNQLPQDCRLIVCGGGEDEALFAEEIKRLDLTGRVIAKGWVDNSEKRELMKTTAVNCLPSYIECLPMTILETMAHGIPNIATGISAIPEVINDENGILITPGDVEAIKAGLLKLFSDDNLRMDMSDKAWQCISKGFSVDVHCGQLLDLYSRMRTKQ